MDLDNEQDIHLMRCLARHVISKAKTLRTDIDQSWNEASNYGKKELLDKAFMDNWQRKNGPEMYTNLMWFIRCELRNGTKTLSDKSD